MACSPGPGLDDCLDLARIARGCMDNPGQILDEDHRICACTVEYVHSYFPNVSKKYR